MRLISERSFVALAVVEALHHLEPVCLDESRGALVVVTVAERSAPMAELYVRAGLLRVALLAQVEFERTEPLD